MKQFSNETVVSVDPVAGTGSKVPTVATMPASAASKELAISALSERSEPDSVDEAGADVATVADVPILDESNSFRYAAPRVPVLR